MLTPIFLLLLSSLSVLSYTDDAINLLVRSNSTTRRYCVELAELPNGHTENVTGFSWHQPYLAPSSVNACNITDLKLSLPETFSKKTLLILRENQCKMTEHAWHVEELFGQEISLMILSNRTDVEYSLTWNTTAMPVSIPVLVFWQKDFDRMNHSFKENLHQLEISISYPLRLPKKFRPATLLMFLLVFLLLLAGNSWAADEFKRKIVHADRHNRSTTSSSSSLTTSGRSNHIETPPEPINNSTPIDSPANRKPENKEPALLQIPYCMIAVILGFAVGWLLLIYYFPKVMIYILQGFFCIGAFSSMISCLNRLTFFVPFFRRYRIPSDTCQTSCTRRLGQLNIATLCAIIISMTLVIVWYICRQEDWAWILQDILGAAICITVISVYRIGNMRVITLILLGFFLYDIFFVFITPYISIFQTSSSNQTTPTTTTTIPSTTSMIHSDSSQFYPVHRHRRLAGSPSVMEQVALGIGTNGEVVPLLFSLPMFIPESEIDPCSTLQRSMLGFGDIILPGILLTFCRLFDIASGNSWPIYYIQSLIAYFVGFSFTHLALYLMNTAQPALLYLVPSVLLSTITTGLLRGELKELYNGRRLKVLLENESKTHESALLADTDQSNGETVTTNPSTDVVVGIDDPIGAANRVTNR